MKNSETNSISSEPTYKYHSFGYFCGVPRTFLDFTAYQQFEDVLNMDFDLIFHSESQKHYDKMLHQYQPSVYGEQEKKYYELEQWILISMPEVIGREIANFILEPITVKLCPEILRTGHPINIKMVMEMSKLKKCLERPYKLFSSRNAEIIQMIPHSNSYLMTLKSGNTSRISPIFRGNMGGTSLIGYNSITLAEWLNDTNPSQKVEINNSDSWIPNSAKPPLIGVSGIFDVQKSELSTNSETLFIVVSINGYFGYFDLSDGSSTFIGTHFIETNDLTKYELLAAKQEIGRQRHFTLLQNEKGDYLTLLDIYQYDQEFVLVNHQFHDEGGPFISNWIIGNLPKELQRYQFSFKSVGYKDIVACNRCNRSHIDPNLCYNPFMDLKILINLLFDGFALFSGTKIVNVFNQISFTKFHTKLFSKTGVWIIKISMYWSEFLYYFNIQSGITFPSEYSGYDVMVNYGLFIGTDEIWLNAVRQSINQEGIYKEEFLFISFGENIINHDRNDLSDDVSSDESNEAISEQEIVNDSLESVVCKGDVEFGKDKKIDNESDSLPICDDISSVILEENVNNKEIT